MSTVTFHDQLLAFEISRLQNTFGNMLQAERTSRLSESEAQAADYKTKCDELDRMADQLCTAKQIEDELQTELNRRAVLIEDMRQERDELKAQLRRTDKHAVKPAVAAEHVGVAPEPNAVPNTVFQGIRP